MSFDITLLYTAGVLYLALLFFIAHATERGWLPNRLIHHPLVYALALGVYATSWSFYGSVGFANSQGYLFLTIYLGVTLAFILTPVILMPILRLVRDYQLTSIADLFAFRYRSPWTGVLVTLFMLVGVMPYIALQIKAVTESVAIITQQPAPHLLALVFCITLIVFAILFGARHISPREKHEGLVVAIAFESAVKLLALLLVGGFALFFVFDGIDGLNVWLETNPKALAAMYEPVYQDVWLTLLLLAFAAAFLLPRQFHMIFVENIRPEALRTAAWAFPLFLLLLNLPIPLILWAGQAEHLTISPDYYALGITEALGPPWLALVTFIGGLSAASAMMIVTTLSLAAMCLNYLILPARFRQHAPPQPNLYGWLLWGRRILIAIIIALGYGFYWLLEVHQGLVQIGLISFVAVAQFLPGLVGVLWWRNATHIGFIAGLSGGIIIWTITLIIPLLYHSGLPVTDFDLQTWLGMGEQDRWVFATFWSLSLNTTLFIIGSLLTPGTMHEQHAVLASQTEHPAPLQGLVDVKGVAEFEARLAKTLGDKIAIMEVQRALSDLGMSVYETHPNELSRLRECLERNLSGLLGPLLSRMIVDNQLSVDPHARLALADSLRFIEKRLEHSDLKLQGLAAELDTLRRYHRQVLYELPLGVCALAPDGEILIWNSSLATISGIPSAVAVNRTLYHLHDPWEGILRTFLNGPDRHLYKVQIQVQNGVRWINLHKAAIEAQDFDRVPTPGGTVLLIEDLTELHQLESEVAHNDRLASIGRLAAGVAHEIGNPLTGIASLAQNLQFETDPEEQWLTARQILEQTRRINNIVQSLITFSHAGNTRTNPHGSTNLRHCVEEAIQLVQLSVSGREISCLNQVLACIMVKGDPQRLLQVFVNLINNALQASQPGDRICIDASVANTKVKITVEDEGSGIPEPLLERIFEPFFTTKPPGEGTGLGLSVVYSIVEDHGGLIYAERRNPRGTRFVLRLSSASESTT